ncbi:hypothetical protein K8S19_08720 [bacterium]|nr:hypothetical protein [bacterium]
MKKLILLSFMMIIITTHAFADIPNTLNYQGRLMDSVQQPVVDGQYAVTFRLYAAESGGTMVWEEAQPVATQNGYFNTVLGNSTALTPSIFNQSLWVSVQVGTNVELSPRQKLGTSAYAMTVADGAITTNKVSDSAITSSKVAVNAITNCWNYHDSNPDVATDGPGWHTMASFNIKPDGGKLLIDAKYSCGRNVGGLSKFRIKIGDNYYAPSETGTNLYAVAFEYKSGGFSYVIEGVPSGEYIAHLQCNRTTGSGTVTMGLNDYISISVLELKK